MRKKEIDIMNNAIDPDEMKPELDADWFEEADAFDGAKLVRRGRPKSRNPKLPVTIRLDEDIVVWFKRGGDGWQTRMNDELRKAAGI